LDEELNTADSCLCSYRRSGEEGEKGKRERKRTLQFVKFK
jgi:hypothetical protein